MNPGETAAVFRRVALGYARIERERMASCCGKATPAQCLLLSELIVSGPSTLASLARRVELDKGWVSRAVERLAHEGLVRKEPSPDDGRIVILAATEVGAAACRVLGDRLAELSGRILSRIPPEDRETVSNALRLLDRAVQDEESVRADDDGRIC